MLSHVSFVFSCQPEKCAFGHILKVSIIHLSTESESYDFVPFNTNLYMVLTPTNNNSAYRIYMFGFEKFI